MLSRTNSRIARNRSMGAAFVEAIIVITSFTLFLMAMAFFRNVYLQKLRVARLSRAAVVAYSMGGCLEGVDPASWVAVDLDPNAAKTTPPPSNNPVPAPATPRVSSQRGNKILGEMSGAGTDGSPLNPVAELGLSMKVALTTTNGRLLAPRRGFHATMDSTSFAACGEEMKNGDFGDIVHYVTDKFDFKNADQEPD